MSPTITTVTTTILLLIFSLTTAPTTATTKSQPLSAYDILKSYDFPVGLLPKGVTGYEFDQNTGEFKLNLPKTCKFYIDSYELEYKTTVSGKLTKDRLYSLKGVSVKVLLLWLKIVEVVRNDDELEFSVGIASANFPLDGFEESPQCGCGFDCVSAGHLGFGDDRVDSLVSTS
ncbi:hypothetical protein RND81_04G088000 [Saponaria officinalis]|uniref:Uncharacterized protein n=1 Tax=Saponaria officinalis TaxID=3572 RepID=A0AAW1LKB0_SAPOF